MEPLGSKPWTWTLLVSALLVVACSPPPSAQNSFPIIGNDPDGLVETMEWGDSPTTATFPANETTVLEILPNSSPSVVQIAVEGSGCPPSAQVLVTGPIETVRVSLILGGAIAPPGVECADILTTHALVIRFKQPIDLHDLKVSAERTQRIGGD